MSERMADADWLEFREAINRLPPPVECFANGAVCPWCGVLHETITFGSNDCRDCRRQFYFGYPEWSEAKGPVSWVNFPHRAFEACGGKARLLAKWEPTDLLKNHYHQRVEDQTGIDSMGTPQ